MRDRIEVVNLSDVGLKRPHNEDSSISDIDKGLLILADGMGGYKAGEIASAIAVTSTHQQISKGLKQIKPGQAAGETGLSPQSQLVKTAIINANTKIYSTASSEASCQGMGTTIVIGLLHDSTLTVAHVGDSRMYRVRGDTFEQVTRDHSLVQELIDRGFYTAEEAAENTPKNLVTRALGIEDKVEVDVIEEAISSGDIYLLCSDGLNDMVEDEEIHLTLSKYSANLVQAAEELVQKANAGGGKDNTSIILMKVK
ncbi:MAG: Stp1/IreP family PP2C-type Ser/Thr phosphatase [Thiotrichales bacterium]|nr:Stp1/IreP family PP2C-type Ser/Thr phosphatase [Thiotrichales bacterium]